MLHFDDLSGCRNVALVLLWFLRVGIPHFSACRWYEERQLCIFFVQRKCQFTALSTPQPTLMLAYCRMKTLSHVHLANVQWWSQLNRARGWQHQAEAQHPGVLAPSALHFLTQRQKGTLPPGRWSCPIQRVFFSCDGKDAKRCVLQLMKFNWRGAGQACGEDLGSCESPSKHSRCPRTCSLDFQQEHGPGKGGPPITALDLKTFA